MLSWGRRRQILYLSVFFLILAVIAVGLYLVYKPKPTCFDQKQNQDEVGVDCGGSCTLACSSQIERVKILWAKPFEISKGYYDFAAMIENQNPNFGVKKIKYTIRFVDDKNILIVDKTGETFLNPKEKFIIFATGIYTGERVAKKAFIQFEDNPIWVRVDKQVPEIYITEKVFDNNGSPRLKATVSNNTLLDLTNVQFNVILSDSEQVSFAASATALNSLARQTSQDIYFTWPVSFPVPPSSIDIYPRINVFELGSGS